MGVGVGVGVLDEIKAISAPSWDWAWAWAELGNIFEDTKNIPTLNPKFCTVHFPLNPKLLEKVFLKYYIQY